MTSSRLEVVMMIGGAGSAPRSRCCKLDTRHAGEVDVDNDARWHAWGLDEGFRRLEEDRLESRPRSSRPSAVRDGPSSSTTATTTGGFDALMDRPTLV